MIFTSGDNTGTMPVLYHAAKAAGRISGGNKMNSETSARRRAVPLYVQCAEEIARRIKDRLYGVGEFIPPERELSQEFKVARLTIRKSLAALIRQGLLQPVPGAGTRVLPPAKPRAPRTYQVACVMPRNVRPPAISPFYIDIFGGLERELAEQSYRLVFAAFDEDDFWSDAAPRRAEEFLARGRYDGAVFIDGVPDSFIGVFIRHNLPLVLVDKQMEDAPIASVMPDNLAGARQAVKHLLDLGHRRIVFLGAPEDPVVATRRNGFQLAHIEAGLVPVPELMLIGGYQPGPAHAAIQAALVGRRTRDFTAVFAINDEAAIGAMKALQEAGRRIPDDVSVVGFDDIPMAEHTHPPLTTVRILRAEMGRQAARALVRQMTGGVNRDETPPRLTLQTELIVRQSSAAPTIG